LSLIQAAHSHCCHMWKLVLDHPKMLNASYQLTAISQSIVLWMNSHFLKTILSKVYIGQLQSHESPKLQTFLLPMHKLLL
jgi:hypothetical protein